MFSYFNDGIKNTRPHKVIDLPELVNIIKNNPNQSKIEHIRLLKRAGDDHFKELKRELPNITPNCVVKERDLKEDKFIQNFLFSSGYIYFDIDHISDVQYFKREFIKKYGHQVALVCISTGGDGLSILFKVGIAIKSKEQFDQARAEIRNTILKDEEIDNSCSDIGRAMFISYDPEVYFNYDNKIEVSIRNTSYYKKGISEPITWRGGINRLSETFSITPIKEVLSIINLRTEVNIDKPLVDVLPVDFATVKFPKKITDGNKHRIYTGMIHALAYLNPDLKSDYLFSYLHFINENFADPPMEFRELTRLFISVYSRIQNEKDYKYSWKRKKYIHFNTKSGLTGYEKRCIAGILNGQKRKNESINKIILAKEELISQGLKVTRKSVASASGLSLSTVKRHYHEYPVDLNELIGTIENSVSPKLIDPNPTFDQEIIAKERSEDPGATGRDRELFPPHRDIGDKDTSEGIKILHEPQAQMVINVGI